MQNIRVASVQFNHSPGNKPINLAEIKTFVKEAASQNVDLIAFPEMCITGYWHVRHLPRNQVDALAEPIPGGPSTQALLTLSKEYNITIGAGLIERESDGALYNTYVVTMPTGQAIRHRKLHCFISEHMASGNDFTVFDMPQGCRVGILTCYDNNIGENVRITALKGAEILLAPHQTGGCNSPDPHTMGKVERVLWASPKTPYLGRKIGLQFQVQKA